MFTFLFRSVSVVALLASLTVATSVFANPVGGTFYGISRAPAYGVRVHQVVYRGGEQADFRITGDGDTILNIIVRDAAGNVVVRTTGPGDRAHVSWRPWTTGTYYIHVVNSGNVYNQYNWRAY